MVKIFSGELEAGESKSFEFFPGRKDKNCVGVLVSSGVEVSLFFDGGNEMVFQGVSVNTNPSISPNKKMIPIKSELKNYLKGKVSNSIKKNIDFSIYLVIQ